MVTDALILVGVYIVTPCVLLGVLEALVSRGCKGL